MTNDKILAIIKGEEFKINIKRKIEKTDIFYDQYVKAARILDDIVAFDDVAISKEWLKTESENNIIAFCGERGEGKSSAMMSFINAAYSLNSNEKSIIFSECKNVKETLFAEPIVMDPSVFDDVHNVLDIVLATLYRKFREKYDLDNQCLSVNKREELLDQFQRVYRCVSLINNQAKMLDDEYDYEGNINKLTKLGESTALRNELKQLIKLYLDVMLGSFNSNNVRKSLIIAIDDLDLCSSNAYKMAEQLRKYLIIPNVVIVMAIKIEQLQLCVKEENFKSYKNIIQTKVQRPELLEEMSSMAERYVAKLIPRARRIYLPKIQTIPYAKVLYKDRLEKLIFESRVKDSMNEVVLDYIFLKTGMKFLINRSGENFLLPNNLRDMVNIITLLGDMEDPEKDNHVYYDNIQKFCNYYEMEWLPVNLDPENCKEIQKLIYSNYIQLHEGTIFSLNKTYNSIEEKFDAPMAEYLSETNYSFFRIINWFEAYRANVFGNTKEKYVYAFYILYTIRLNELWRQEEYEEFTKFMGGYIWAGSFMNVLPNAQYGMFNRSRFWLPTIQTFNTLAKMLYPDLDMLLSCTTGFESYISKIPEKDENREKKLWVWLLLGLVSNTYVTNQSNQITYTFHTVSVIRPNYALLPNVQISLENYMVALCNLRSLYEKINMELLGIERLEFDKFINSIEMHNKDTIDAFRKILSNVDLALKFKEYCQEHRDSKEGGAKDEVRKTKAAVDKFFKNVESFMGKYVEEHSDDKLIRFHTLILQYDEAGNKREIDVSQMYGLLVQASLNNGRKGEEMQNFISKLRKRVDFDTPLRSVSTYLVKKTAENAKVNMDNLASNIQRYYSKYTGEQLEESEITVLSDFYSKIMDLYVQNPKIIISDVLSEEYKEVVYRFKKTCEYGA